MVMRTSISSSVCHCKNLHKCAGPLPEHCREVGGVAAEPLLVPSFATCVLDGNEECCMQLPVHQREGTVYHVNNLLFPWQLATSMTFRIFPQYKLCVLYTT